MVAEEVVLAAARTVCAAHAADKENSHAHRHQDGEEASIRRKPMNKIMHIQGHHIVASETHANDLHGREFSERRTSGAISVASPK
jgi:hypothetical protein